MNQEEKRKLVESRREELKKKVLENELRRDVESEYNKISQKKIREKYDNKYVHVAIIFLSTLIFLYLILFSLKVIFVFFFGFIFSLYGINLDLLDPFLHTVIWILSIVSAYRKRSVLDDIF